MLNIYGTGKGAVEQFKLYHLCKKFIVEVVDKVLMYFLPLKNWFIAVFRGKTILIL